MQLFAILFLAGVLSGGIGSWKLTSIYFKGKEAATISQANKEKEKAMKLAFDLEKMALEKQHADELSHAKIIKEVIKYVPKIQKVPSECNYSNGTIRVLNSAVDSMPSKTPAVSVADDTKSSNVTEYTGIRYALDVLAAYKKAQNQCNALIDYVSKK